MQLTSRVALVVGAGGQDGYFLTRLLDKKRYVVHGLIREESSHESEIRTKKLRQCLPHINMHRVDLLRTQDIITLIRRIKPDEIYHLAANSFIGSTSADDRRISNEIHPLETILELIISEMPETRLFFSSSSEIFDTQLGGRKTSDSSTSPESRYGTSKLACQNLVRNARETYGLFCVSGILFNHESIERAPHFLCRKLSLGIAKIVKGQADDLWLGNLDIKKDWGCAEEFSDAMWLALQAPVALDSVIGTGQLTSVRSIVAEGFRGVGLDYRDFVKFDPALARKLNRKAIFADVQEPKERLGWSPKRSIFDVVRSMVSQDIGIIYDRSDKTIK